MRPDRGRAVAAARAAGAGAGHRHRVRVTRRGLCLLLALLALALMAMPAQGAPARNPRARAGDCPACHGAQAVLPATHPPTRDMDLKRCRSCHAPATAHDLTGTLRGSHLHALSGVACARCHTGAAPDADVDFERCLACHDPVALAQASAGRGAVNPHDSPHYGKQADCNLCHHQHARSEDYCAHCHSFELHVP